MVINIDDMQLTVNQFSYAADVFGLKIDISKTSIY